MDLIAEQFFREDVWDLRKCPVGAGILFEKCFVERVLDFSGIDNEALKDQLKDYLRYEMTQEYEKYREAATVTTQNYLCWERGIQFLRETDYPVRDFVEDFAELNKRYVDYVKERWPGMLAGNRSGSHYIPNNLLTCLRRYLFSKREEALPIWEKNIWYRDSLPLFNEQVNLASGPISLRFDFARDSEDLKYIKICLRYMLEERRVSFSTAASYLNSIKKLTEWQQKQGRTFLNTTREEAKEFCSYMKSRVKHATFDSRIANLFIVYEYLQTRELVTSNPIQYTERFRDPYHYRLATVDDQTIVQVFCALQHIKPRLVTMFLLVYSTGMRVSEVCQIRNDCLIKNEKGTFVLYYCQKMQKDVMSPICSALYKRVEEEVRRNAELDWDEEYLFWREPHKPYIAQTFRVRLQEELNKYGICCPDGKLFKFRPHDLRHTIATKLYKSGSTIAVIQKLLHHVSIEMSLAYVECDSEHMWNQHTKYLNYRGENVPIEHDTERIQWLRENMNAQALPNGICGLPVEMGKCLHCNACLDGCPYFKTSKEYLPVHRRHLKGMEEYIQQCTVNGWEVQLEGVQRVRDNLKSIIRRLQDE